MNTDSAAQKPPLAESPWFWLALFAGMALFALVVIQGKYTRRQGRFDQRYVDKLEAQQHAAHQRQELATQAEQSGGAAVVVGPAEADDANESEKEGVRMNEARARTSLISLMVVAGVVVSLAVVMLVLRRTS
ncbi:MAG: hypothetical protein K2Y37_10830 [Pirellulales bacterium]|nr:hypothetical protein [Pirellulales bacterium]